MYGLREGYKNSADELVEIAVNPGGNNKILDAYIFPILISYRHCIEISLISTDENLFFQREFNRLFCPERRN